MNPTLTVFFVLLGLVPFVPSVTDPWSILFACSFFGLLIKALVARKGVLKTDRTMYLILFFVGVVVPINFFVGLIHGLSPTDIFRAAIPFLFMLFYVVCINFKVTNNQIVTGLIISASSWAASIVLFNLGSFISVLSGDIGRLTYSVTSMLIPFGLIGFVLLLYANEALGRFRLFALGIFFLLIVASGYRSQILLAVAVVIFKYRNVLNFRSVLALSVMSVSGIMFVSFNPRYLETMVRRFQFSAGDTVRSAEMDYAMSIFSNNMLFGAGLGTPVPVAATRPESVWELFEKDTVSYIHSFVGYVSMNLGLLGLLFFVALFLGVLIKAARVSFFRKSWHEEASLVLLLSMLAYFQVSASFRQVQMWVVVSCLLYIVNRPKVSGNE